MEVEEEEEEAGVTNVGKRGTFQDPVLKVAQEEAEGEVVLVVVEGGGIVKKSEVVYR